MNKALSPKAAIDIGHVISGQLFDIVMHFRF